MSRSFFFLFASIPGFAIGFFGCGSSSSQNLAPPIGSGGATSSSGSDKTSATGLSTSTASGCGSACASGEFCSVTNKCIANGTCGDNGDCKTKGTICDPKTMTCVPGGCMSTEIPANRVPPNLLITLDRSCSMNDVVKGTTLTKWQIAQSSIDTLTIDFKDQIRFGMLMFPERFTMQSNNCIMLGPIPVPVGAGNEGAVQMLMADPSYAPVKPCVTNIDTGMAEAATDPGLADPMRASYVLLMTDGEQANCNAGMGNAGTLATIQQLAAMNVHTFVIGFGSGVNKMQLDSFAQAGMEPNTGPNQYYDANDQASLDATFKAIAQKTIGCVFQLTSTPEDPSQIYVFFDDASIPRDTTHTNGWDYDATKNQITFYGGACSELKAGSVTKVDIVYGCDEPPPH